LLSYLSATTDRARARNHCYESHTVTPGGVPKYKHSSQRPKTTKLVSQLLRRAIYLDPSVPTTTSTFTPATLANPSSTQGFLMFICHPEPQLKRCYSEPQLKEYHALNPLSRATTQGYVLSSTQGTPTIPPLKHHQKPCRSRLQNQQPKVAAAKSASRGHVLPCAASSQTAWWDAYHQAPCA